MRNMSNDIKRFAVAVLAACGLAVSAALAEPTHQAKLTVQGYDGAELTNFPVLVRLSSQSIKGFNGDACEDDGSDLRFVNDTGDVYPHEIDTWDRFGESLVWVKLPQLAKGKSFFVQWGGWGDRVKRVPDLERQLCRRLAHGRGEGRLQELDEARGGL